ncbi:ABC transporter permease [Dyadobacter bucti]|uniref:ABC transporter permease n=1 Tax=Dyadobacter bucti TaxID=2572203 RepID=UPI0011090528|nr:ABC transporter permease [Dyadobacter bucti]
MLQNYLKIAWRTFWRGSVVSLVNISGLAIGLAVTLLIVLYVAHEYSFDRFHSDGERVMRAQFRHFEGEELYTVSAMSFGFAGAVRNASDHIQDFGRISEKGFGSKLIRSDANHAWFEPDFRFADEGFLRLFSFPFVLGNPENALKNPGTVLLTEKSAKKYFGTVNPMGKTIVYDKRHYLLVVGVLKDPPANSSVQFDFLADLRTFRAIEVAGYKAMMDEKTARQWTDNIGTGGAYETYFLLHEKGSHREIEKLIPGLLTESEKIRESKDSYKLLPLYDVHFSLIAPDSQEKVMIFSAIAGMILILALINYINLTTARSSVRGREVSVRKIVGAARKALVVQFYLESVLYVTLAYVLAFLLFVTLQPVFYKTLHLNIDRSFLLTPFFLIPAAAFWVVSVLLSGSYPALLLSGFTAIKTLKGTTGNADAALKIRKGLTVFQFTVSIALIIGSVLVKQQMDFFLQKDLGIDRARVATVFLDSEDGLDKHYKIIREEVSHIKGVEAVTASNLLMYGDYMNAWRIKRIDAKKETDAYTYPVDEEFIKTMHVKWAVEPSKKSGFNTGNAIVINEVAARQLGINAKNYRQTVDLGNGLTKEVVGIIEDFHYVKLAQQIRPMALFVGNDTTFRNYLYIKISKGASVPETIAAVQRVYNRYKTIKPFEYAFLDDTYRYLYASELEMGTIVSSFTAFAILIASLGLFGLATFTAEQRTKEIGIRKVLGASVSGIVSLLSRDFLTLVLIAVLISSPVAWWVMGKWLESFAYRIEIEWWVFFLAGATGIVIALLTVGFHSIKAALMNPVKALKVE